MIRDEDDSIMTMILCVRARGEPRLAVLSSREERRGEKFFL